MALITPDGTLSYPHLFQPQMPMNPKPGQKARYSTVILFPKDMSAEDKARLLELKKAALKALTDKHGDQAKVEKMLKSGGLRWPFSKKWENKRGEQQYDPDKWDCFIRPWSEQPPGIVSRYRGPDGKAITLTNAADIYPGVIARISVNCFVYNQQGNEGVGFGLQNVQKRGDGTRLDGRVDARDEFDAEDSPVIEAELETTDDDVTAVETPTGSSLADLFS